MEKHFIHMILNNIAAKFAFHLPSIDKTMYTRIIGLININNVFNNKIKLHLYGYN